jgi:hypothetical protein
MRSKEFINENNDPFTDDSEASQWFKEITKRIVSGNTPVDLRHANRREWALFNTDGIYAPGGFIEWVDEYVGNDIAWELRKSRHKSDKTVLSIINKFNKWLTIWGYVGKHGDIDAEF